MKKENKTTERKKEKDFTRFTAEDYNYGKDSGRMCVYEQIKRRRSIDSFFTLF